MQGSIRTIGRLASYIIIAGCYTAIAFLYKMYSIQTYDNVRAIGFTLLYAILVQDTINAMIQIMLICCIGDSGKPEGCGKIMKMFVLKEIWNLFPAVPVEVVPVNEHNIPPLPFKEEEVPKLDDVKRDDQSTVVNEQKGQ